MRQFFVGCAALLCCASVFAAKTPAPATATMHWLEDAPGMPVGVSWGIPWKQGEVKTTQVFELKAADGAVLPVQTWPMAYWPDGSVKWSGVATSVAGEQGPYTITAVKKAGAVSDRKVTVEETPDAIEIETGVLHARILKQGDNIIASLAANGTVIAENGQLVTILEDRSRLDGDGIVQYQQFIGKINSVTLEQKGPARATVKIEGMHNSDRFNRAWMPFTVRLYFYAGVQTVQMVHSIVYDGDQHKDFVKGLGVMFDIPLREEIQNRHVRFSGEDGGLWAEPIQPLTGRAMMSIRGMRSPYAVQLEGGRIPDRETLDPRNQKLLDDWAVWNQFKLNQLSPDGFTVRKRTGDTSSWIGTAGGNRAEGLVMAGDVSGGLAVSLKNFWQSYPASLEVTDMRSDKARMTVWMWSPDAEAMDLQHYDTVAHDLNSSYEDVVIGLETPYGIARTSELTLFALDSIPSRDMTVAMSRLGASPAHLFCDPAYYKEAKAFGGYWTLPDRSVPALEWVENQLDSSFMFYRKMREYHKWYGFWNYGDFMHSQDGTRHTWNYDIGGNAWDNSELSPDNWLWLGFLRSGDPAVYKMAEALTRHTGEVDCYHIGDLQGLGSRHNVSHWGCGAKEARIAQAGFRRYFYYLTTDERAGDIMREMLHADQAVAVLDPMRIALPVSEAPMNAPTRVRFGPDWISLVANWMTEWERTGDKKWKERIERGMNSFAKMPNMLFTGRQVYGFDPVTAEITLDEQYLDEVNSQHLATIMGGAEMMFELMDLIDNKDFKKAWIHYCEYYSMPRNDEAREEKYQRLPTNSFLIPRMTAYAAYQKKDMHLAERAWSEFAGRMFGSRSMFSLTPVEVPYVLNPIEENRGVSTNSVAQWGINAVFIPGFLKELGYEFKLPEPASMGMGMFGFGQGQGRPAGQGGAGAPGAGGPGAPQGGFQGFPGFPGGPQGGPQGARPTPPAQQ